jgi:methionine-rich copper-binding protein CopC
MNRILVFPIVLSLAASASSLALAHAFPDHSVPPVGSTLNAAPAKVQMWFTQSLEPAFSGMEVTDAKGARVDDGNPAVDGQNPALLSVGLKPMAPGEYTVHWHVISVDTHPTEGDFSFTVIGTAAGAAAGKAAGP